MKLLYDVDSGDVYYAVYDRDTFGHTHTTTPPLYEFHIDEISPDNEGICIDLKRNAHAVSLEGRRKYQVINNELHSLDGWEAFRI